MLVLNKLFCFSLCVFWVSFSLCFNKIVANSENDQDLPSLSDLTRYWIPLERIINFSNQHQSELNLNFIFGLFLVNVNLKPFTTDDTLPKGLKNNLDSLLKVNDKIIAKYTASTKNNDAQSDAHMKIAKLFQNVKLYRRFPNLKLGLLEEDDILQAVDEQDWQTYASKISSLEQVPQPHLSDACLASLFEYEDVHAGAENICVIPEDCRKMVRDGTNYGYALTHRMLFILFAQFYRRCTVISLEEDEQMKKTFCSMMYKEAKFIVSNGYKVADLIFEQIALCGLNGNAEFIRQSWLTILLHSQTMAGCFNTPPNTTINRIQDLDDKNCDSHFSTLAAISLAEALRFIFENIEPQSNTVDS